MTDFLLSPSCRPLLDFSDNSGPTSSSQKTADSRLARERLYKPHVGPQFVVN